MNKKLIIVVSLGMTAVLTFAFLAIRDISEVEQAVEDVNNTEIMAELGRIQEEIENVTEPEENISEMNMSFWENIVIQPEHYNKNDIEWEEIPELDPEDIIEIKELYKEGEWKAEPIDYWDVYEPPQPVSIPRTPPTDFDYPDKLTRK